MKTYKYSTKERAERISKSLGCSGFHSHGTGDDKKYMPCKDMKTFKQKIKKGSKEKEEEVNELVDEDGTWETSNIPLLNPASTLKGSTITDKIVPMARNPRDPLLKGWYGYYGESVVKEEDMEDAFGFEDTKFMNYNDTVKYFEKELDLDKEDAVDRAKQQGKGPKLAKRAPKKIKDKKNFIDRLVLKELDDDMNEDVIFNKDKKDHDISPKEKNHNPLLLKNVKSLKSMAEKMGVSISELIELLKNEQ